MTCKITFKSAGRTYEWCGGYGGIIKSYEYGVKKGQTRVIEDILFYAYSNYGREINWSVIDVDADKIRMIKSKLLGVY